MSNGLKPAEAEQPRLGKASTLTRLALIGVALAAVVGNVRLSRRVVHSA